MLIELSQINKTFRVARRNAGFGSALKALFSREYENIHALNDVSFKIDTGEMVGYIGPNGAGKSSTIKIMSGILTPDSGQCLINGLVPWKNRKEHVSQIGVVFGQRSQLWWDVPVIDSFELIRDIYKVKDSVYKNNIDMLSEMLNLSQIMKTPARQLSLGQRMRCEIAASLIHDPKILFLDEPTIGLDAVSKIAVRTFIKQLNREKKTTVILTTHDMQDIEALTERILLIGKGRILLDGSLTELKQKNSRYKKITAVYSDLKDGDFILPKGIMQIEKNPSHGKFTIDTCEISVSDAISALVKSADIMDISIEGTSAEELVVSLYKEYGI